MDPYSILGVAKTATLDEVKNAYRTLAKKHHPDLNPGNKSAETKFKEINAAYELIGTPEMKSKFDRGETAEQQEQANRARPGGPSYYNTQQEGGRYSYSFDRGGGMDDLFENLFQGGARGAGGGRARSGSASGEDQLYQMEVEFRDSILGVEREISLPSGKKLRVKIPPGVESGARLRFKGQGGAGIGQGPAGDAYVEILVRPQPGFNRVGNDLETETPVSFIEAVLGAEVPLTTLDGTVMLKVPEGVTTGSRLRVKGKGVPYGDKQRGDLIVKLKIALPKKIDPALKDALRSWDGKFSYNPRSEI